MAFEPLLKIASDGIPVILVAGNHERSFIQQSVLEMHKNIYIFNILKSLYLQINTIKVQVTGFPCIRKNVRVEFPPLLKKIDYKYENSKHIHLLCMHQAIEGAQVGVQNYTFRSNHDTIRAVDIPSGFSAILSGHIHRAQILTHGLDNSLLNSKVYYAGSIERTSFAERNEQKGYFILTVNASINGGEIIEHKFVPLPIRPMIDCEIKVRNNSKIEIISEILKQSKQWHKDSIVKIKLNNNTQFNKYAPTIKEIRQVLPETMNIEYKVDS
jgi:DNA repair exonuclease SbcCD nuclease subunit